MSRGSLRQVLVFGRGERGGHGGARSKERSRRYGPVGIHASSPIATNLQALNHNWMPGRAPAAGEKAKKRRQHPFSAGLGQPRGNKALTPRRALRSRGCSCLRSLRRAERGVDVKQIKNNVRIHSPTHSKMSTKKKKKKIFYSPIKRKLLTPGTWASRILQGLF